MSQEDDESVEEIASKTWDIMENKLKKVGYREGAAAGKESVFQASFDSGYTEGFKIGYIKGRLKAISSVLKDEKRLSANLSDTNTDLSTKPCFLCKDDVYNELEKIKSEEMLSFLRENNALSIETLKSKYLEISSFTIQTSHS